jgi:hypothetical protein
MAAPLEQEAILNHYACRRDRLPRRRELPGACFLSTRRSNREALMIAIR